MTFCMKTLTDVDLSERDADGEPLPFGVYRCPACGDVIDHRSRDATIPNPEIER